MDSADERPLMRGGALRLATPRLIDAVLVVAALGALTLVLLAHGVLPGELDTPGTAYLTEGAIRCEDALGLHALTSYCHSFGAPFGYPLLTNAPTIALGTIAVRLGASLNGAYLISGAVVQVVALAGCYALARRLGVGRVVAIWASALYLLAPTTLGLVGFPGTGAGFELLPCYVLADLILLESVSGRRPRMVALVFAIYSAVRIFALFMDGYSFLASVVISVSLWAFYGNGLGLRDRRRWIALAAILAANGIAVGLYYAYQGASYPLTGLPIFRAWGLDVSTLVLPFRIQWIPTALGVTTDPTKLWGDSTNSAYNYIGFGAVALAILGVRTRYGPALLCAGVIALIVSLGPGLKVHALPPAGVPPASAMPAHAATLELPWGSLFTKIPGLDQTRAVYRWFGATRLAVLMLAALGIERGLRGRRWTRILVVVLAVFATLELLPNFPALNRDHRQSNREVKTFTETVGNELRSVTHPGEYVFFLNDTPGALSEDDFAANYLAPYAGIRTYNDGGDKNVYLSQVRWPPQIAALATSKPTPAAVQAALSAPAASVVIAPLFDFVIAGNGWAPTAAQRAQALRSYRPLFDDPHLSIQRRRYLVAIRLRKGE